MLAGWKIALKNREFANPLVVALRLSLPNRLRILCYPGHPSRWQVLYKVCALNGFLIQSDPAAAYDLGVHFIGHGPCTLPAQPPVLNRDCTNISKRHVSTLFAEVFGYELEVDPTRYTGQMVEKSDANYTHDGRIISGPIHRDDVRSGYVYQRLVDAVEGDEAIDLRTPLYDGKVPLVYIKRRPVVSRFSNENTSVAVCPPEEVFSKEEQEKLSIFSKRMGLDFGEVDILRDRLSGRIFIVDVANTPAGPPNGLNRKEAKAAIARLTSEFRKLVSRRLPARC